MEDHEQNGLIISRILIGTIWTSSKRNAVCVGGFRGVTAYSGAAVSTTLQEKQAKKKVLQTKTIRSIKELSNIKQFQIKTTKKV